MTLFELTGLLKPVPKMGNIALLMFISFIFLLQWALSFFISVNEDAVG